MIKVYRAVRSAIDFHDGTALSGFASRDHRTCGDTRDRRDAGVFGLTYWLWMDYMTLR
mgnify:CR=1 FL=1